MRRFSIFVVISGMLALASGCASKGYVRKSVNASADTLTARIETDEGEMKEIRDNADKKIAAVDSKYDTRVSALDSKTTEGFNSVRGDIKNVDQHAGEARSAADRAQNDVNGLGTKFQNRNMFNTTDEKSVQFKFNSATLDKQYTDALDQIAASVMQNPDAIIVLEGRTDSTGNKDYNVKLGERRIEAVRHYLAVEKGVPVYKIHEISFGSEKPLAENNTKDGREKNRAVIMTVMTPKLDAVASRENN
jgi:OmpA-OmpF porin, OOP family